MERETGYIDSPRCDCGASVPDGWCFCDADCRDDYEREIAARRREGLHK